MDAANGTRNGRYPEFLGNTVAVHEIAPLELANLP